MTPDRDFEAEATALRQQLTRERDVAVARLRALHEAWARSDLGLDETGDLVAQVRAAVERGVDPRAAADAIERLGLAEQHQWEIGTWATGSGEGLASMFEVRSLQLSQAWLWSALPGDDAHAHAARLRTEVDEDPNRIADRYAADVAALSARLDAAS